MKSEPKLEPKLEALPADETQAADSCDDADIDDDQPVGLARKRKKKLRRAGSVEKHEALFLSRAAALDYRNALSAADIS